MSIEVVTGIRLFCDKCDRVLKDEHNNIIELSDDIDDYKELTKLAQEQSWLFDENCLTYLCPECQKGIKK